MDGDLRVLALLQRLPVSAVLVSSVATSQDRMRLLLTEETAMPRLGVS